MIHPGEQLLEYLSSKGLRQSDLAQRSGLTNKTISVICSGKAAISVTTAIKLESALGRPARFWCMLQLDYDIEKIRRRMRKK